MGLPPVAKYTQHTVHLSTSEPFFHTYQQWNSMGCSKLSHWVKGTNALLKRNIIMSAAPETLSSMCNKRYIKPFNKLHFKHALRLNMLLAYFQYLIKTPFGIFYKTGAVLNQTATYRKVNARHTPCTDCQRTANCTLHSCSHWIPGYTWTYYTFRKPNRFVNVISCSFTLNALSCSHTIKRPKHEWQ